MAVATLASMLLVTTMLVPEAARAAAPTIENLQYLTVHGVYPDPVTLVDGDFVGEPFVEGGAARPRLTLLKRLWNRADVDGDGAEELIVLLAESAAGSGTRLYLSIVSPASTGAETMATRLLGDRVQIRSMSTTGSDVSLGLVVAGPDEPACCPSRKVQASYRFANGELTETSREEGGALGLGDLAGKDWRLGKASLEELAKNLDGSLALDTVRITARFEHGQVQGISGCNQYSATFEADSPYTSKTGPVRSTRKACEPRVMTLETQYLDALGAVRQFGFLLGDLVLTYQVSDGIGTLLLAAPSDE